MTKCLIQKDSTPTGLISVFTESLRSPQLEDLILFDKILPKCLLNAKRDLNITRFTTADKFKDNIYV